MWFVQYAHGDFAENPLNVIMGKHTFCNGQNSSYGLTILKTGETRITIATDYVFAGSLVFASTLKIIMLFLINAS